MGSKYVQLLQAYSVGMEGYEVRLPHSFVSRTRHLSMPAAWKTQLHARQRGPIMINSLSLPGTHAMPGDIVEQAQTVPYLHEEVLAAESLCLLCRQHDNDCDRSGA